MPARPPSERGIEYDLSEKIDKLTKVLEYIPSPSYPASPNWWDVLPKDVSEALAGTGYKYVYSLSSFNNTRPAPQLQVVQYPDRIELSLLCWNNVVWQRTLFFVNPRV